MTAITTNSQPSLSTKIINTLLSIKPLAEFAKSQARKMIITRANKIGVPWQENVNALQAHDWESELVRVENPHLVYPDYYLTSFHAYEKGNLDWQCAWEVESAAYSVHSTIYSPTPSMDGDRSLRQNYHQVLHMNPQSQVYQKMPRYVFTLLKSTEPYLDQYFSLDIAQELVKAGFQSPSITSISVRHRTVIAYKP